MIVAIDVAEHTPDTESCLRQNSYACKANFLGYIQGTFFVEINKESMSHTHSQAPYVFFYSFLPQLEFSGIHFYRTRSVVTGDYNEKLRQLE